MGSYWSRVGVQYGQPVNHLPTAWMPALFPKQGANHLICRGQIVVMEALCLPGLMVYYQICLMALLPEVKAQPLSHTCLIPSDILRAVKGHLH